MDVAEGADALQKLADASEYLIDLGVRIRDRGNVSTASAYTYLRNYQSGAMCELYLEVTLASSAVVVGFLEVSWQPQWLLRSGIRVNRDSEQERLEDFDDRIVLSVTELSAQLNSALKEIERSIDNYLG